MIKVYFIIILFSCSFSFGQIITNVKANNVPCDTNICKEIMPQYPGGIQKLINAIQDSINYPDKALLEKIGGKVFIRFMIDTSGKIIKPEIMKGIREDIDNEALRVVTVVPPFIPGKQCCKPVKVFYNIPILFDPTKRRKKKK